MSKNRLNINEPGTSEPTAARLARLITERNTFADGYRSGWGGADRRQTAWAMLDRACARSATVASLVLTTADEDVFAAVDLLAASLAQPLATAP